MNTITQFRHPAWIRTGKRVLAILTMLLPLISRGGGVVTECTEANLRAAMAGGGTVTFACDGTITLASTITNAADIVLDATGHQITLSGGNTIRVFTVASNVTFTAVNLTIANGLSESGAAILSAGSVFATNCVFSGNVASNQSSQVKAGGAVYNLGLFVASRCTFRQNETIGVLSGAFQWPPPAPSDSQGGAVCNFGVLVIESGLFVGNKVIGQEGANGVSVAFCGPAGGPGYPGGAAYGGALFNAGVATLVNSTIISNTCAGGRGGSGGSGGFYYHSGDIYYCTPGGDGGDGGNAIGSGIYTVGHAANLTNCTVAHNSAHAGIGGPGGIGSWQGAGGASGTASGAIQANVNSMLANNVFSTNAPSNGSGTNTDLGHNLSSDGSCAFTNVGSLNNTDPKLGPLADNGGPTLTMALLPGSPAIDAGDNLGTPPTDQRGITRPFGAASDIGAYEYAPLLRISRSTGNGLDILLCDGTPGQTCRLLTSTSLSNWVCMATNQVGANGTFLFEENCDERESGRFYKVALP
jgi:hypothetical protein